MSNSHRDQPNSRRHLILSTLLSVAFAWIGSVHADLATAQQISQSDDAPVGEPSRPKSEEPLVPLPAIGIGSARAALIDIDESQLDQLVNYRRTLENSPTLLKILFRLEQLPLDDLQRFARRNAALDLSMPGQAPEKYRTEVIPLNGNVVRCERIELLPVFVDLYAFTHYYRVEISSTQIAQPMFVYTREMPERWQNNDPDGERVGLFGMFLKVGDQEIDGGPLEFAAKKLEWYPTESSSLVENHGQLLLARQGFDVSLFDDVKRTNGRPMERADSGCFYRLLRASRDVEASITGDDVELVDLQLVDLLRDTESKHGAYFEVEGIVRRITKIRVEGDLVRRKLGSDSYYQFDVFVPMGNQPIRMVSPDGAKSPIFRERYPVTICVAAVPDDFDREQYLNRSVRFPAFFFKLWSYDTPFIRQQSDDMLQKSPMFVGGRVELVEHENRSLGLITFVVLAAGVVMIGGIWVWLYSVGQGDRRFETYLRRKKTQRGNLLPRAGHDKGADTPDFSKLDDK